MAVRHGEILYDGAAFSDLSERIFSDSYNLRLPTDAGPCLPTDNGKYRGTFVPASVLLDLTGYFPLIPLNRPIRRPRYM